jgi:hypothetical protein
MQQLSLDRAHTRKKRKPAIAIPLMWLGAIVVWAIPPESSDAYDLLVRDGLVLLVAVVFTFAYSSFGGRLKEVFLDDGQLIISDADRRIVVPLRDVEKVSEVRASKLGGRYVFLHFRRATEFGRWIAFMPVGGPQGLFAGYHAHPLVAELRGLVEEASR